MAGSFLRSALKAAETLWNLVSEIGNLGFGTTLSRHFGCSSDGPRIGRANEGEDTGWEKESVGREQAGL
jgi:hypothetical protein